MGSGKGAEHQAEEADADLGIPRVARWADCDLSAGLVRLPRDDRKLGLRDRRRAAAAALPHSSAVRGWIYFPIVATLRAASGPCWSSTSKASAPLRMGTFNSIALSYLDPGASPTTTKLVFFDTDPETLPPREVIASVATSRE